MFLILPTKSNTDEETLIYVYFSYHRNNKPEALN